MDFFGTQAESHFSMSMTHSVVSEHSGHPLFGESSLPEAVASVPKMAFDPPQVHTTTHKLASFPRLSPSLRCKGTSIALSSLEPALWVFQGFGSCVCYGHITQLGTKIQASCVQAGPASFRRLQSRSGAVPHSRRTTRISRASSCFWSVAASRRCFF